MDIEELERRKRAAQGKMDEFLKAWGSREGWGREFTRLSEELRQSERDLASAKGEEHAVSCDLGVRWDTGAPLPHLLAGGDKTYLVFIVTEPSPAREGNSLALKSPTSDAPESLAIVEFESATVKFGSPNDEVLEGHPLYGKGLTAYGAHYVINSRWLRELDEIQKVHPRYSLERGRDLKHYLFAFHDETFECLARSHRVERRRSSLKEAVRSLAEKLTSQ